MTKSQKKAVVRRIKYLLDELQNECGKMHVNPVPKKRKQYTIKKLEAMV